MVREKILEALSFNTMADRQKDIAAAHKNTFTWLFRPKSYMSPKSTWTNFLGWLRSGHGTYWISGKLGLVNQP